MRQESYEARHARAYAYCMARSDELVCWGWRRSATGRMIPSGDGRRPNASHYLARRPRADWARIVRAMLRSLRDMTGGGA